MKTSLVLTFAFGISILATGALAQQCGLPSTGQTLCYDLGGAKTCPVAGFPRQDAETIYNAMSFSQDNTVPTEPTILDLVTGLQWTKAKWGPMDWQDALIWCADSLNARSYGGHTDWRLPNVKELLSIADFGRSSPAIDPAFQLDCPPLNCGFLTSTTTDHSPQEVRVVTFGTGNDTGCGWYGTCLKTDVAFYVRAVRGEGSGIPATGQTKCYDNAHEQQCPVEGFPAQDAQHVYHKMKYVEDRSAPGETTIYDSVTGLEWGKAYWGLKDWGAALRWCADSLNSRNYGGHSDWRLPNAKELQSIVDYGRSSDAIDPIFGPQGGLHYWSSTSWVHTESERAWALTPWSGVIQVIPKVDSILVRPVRCGVAPIQVQPKTWGKIKDLFH